MHRRRSQRTLWMPVIGVSGLMVAGCDPCAGTAGCRTNPLLTATGQIVRNEDGRGVAGVRVHLARARSAADSASTVTDASGHWRISIPAGVEGDASVDVEVSSERAQYRVDGVPLRAHTTLGEGNLLGRWVDRPHFPISAQVERRGGQREALAGAMVEFRRTGGIEMVGPGVANGSAFGPTDLSGRVSLFGLRADVWSTTLGDVVGEVRVTPPGGATIVTRDVRLGARYIYRQPLEVIVIGVGPAINWVMVVKNRATHEPQSGAQVRFTRTGGIDVTPTTFTAVSNEHGHVTVPIRALAEGTVVGDLEVTPPAPGQPIVFRDVQFATFDSDAARFHGVLDVMPYMPYLGAVKIAGEGASNIQIEFRRTGGIPLAQEVITTRSVNGGFALRPVPLGQGEVIGDLTIHAPAPFTSFVVRNLRMSTVDGPGFVPDRLLHVWDIDRGPSGPTGTTVVPLTGASVRRQPSARSAQRFRK
jgi:hypothetical protein